MIDSRYYIQIQKELKKKGGSPRNIPHKGDYQFYYISNLFADRGIKPSKLIDMDGDGIIDIEDCNPRDPDYQGILSSIRSRVSKAVSTVKSGVSKAVSATKSAVSSAVSATKSAVSRVTSGTTSTKSTTSTSTKPTTSDGRTTTTSTKPTTSTTTPLSITSTPTTPFTTSTTTSTRPSTTTTVPLTTVGYTGVYDTSTGVYTPAGRPDLAQSMAMAPEGARILGTGTTYTGEYIPFRGTSGGIVNLPGPRSVETLSKTVNPTVTNDLIQNLLKANMAQSTMENVKIAREHLNTYANQLNLKGDDRLVLNDKGQVIGYSKNGISYSFSAQEKVSQQFEKVAPVKGYVNVSTGEFIKTDKNPGKNDLEKAAWKVGYQNPQTKQVFQSQEELSDYISKTPVLRNVQGDKTKMTVQEFKQALEPTYFQYQKMKDIKIPGLWEKVTQGVPLPKWVENNLPKLSGKIDVLTDYQVKKITDDIVKKFNLLQVLTKGKSIEKYDPSRVKILGNGNFEYTRQNGEWVFFSSVDGTLSPEIIRKAVEEDLKKKGQKEIKLITAEFMEPYVREALAKSYEITGTVGATGLSLVGLGGEPLSGGATTGLVLAGAGLKATTGLVADVIRTDNNLNVQESWKELQYNVATGGLQAFPLQVPVGGLKSLSVAGTTAAKLKTAGNIALFGFGALEKVSTPAFDIGLTQRPREYLENYEMKKVEQMMTEQNIFKKSLLATQGSLAGATGVIALPKTRSEALQNIAIGTFLAADYAKLKPAQNIFMYGVAPTLGSKTIMEADRPSQYLLGGLAFAPIVGATFTLGQNVLSKLVMEDVIPGVSLMDLKGARTTVDLEFNVDGKTKRMVYDKASSKVQETPGGGFSKNLAKEDITLRDVLKTAQKEIFEETGIQIPLNNLKLNDVINSPIETQFVVKLKKPLTSSDLPTKLTSEAKKEGITNYQLIDKIGSSSRNLKLYPYVSPYYTGIFSGVKRLFEAPPTGLLRQQDIIALKRSEAIDIYNKLPQAEKNRLAKIGEDFFIRKAGGDINKLAQLRQEGVFKVDFGKEYYLYKKGLGERVLRTELKEFKINYDDPLGMETFINKRLGGKVTAERVKKFDVRDITTWDDIIRGKKPGTFKEGTGKRVSKLKSELSIEYSKLGELDKLRLKELGYEFYTQSFRKDTLRNLIDKNVDLGERYYLLVNGIGTKLELTRLKQLSELQISPFEAQKSLSMRESTDNFILDFIKSLASDDPYRKFLGQKYIPKRKLVKYKSGREVILEFGPQGKIQKTISKYRVNPEMSMVLLPHSRYRGNLKEVAKLINEDYFPGTSLSPNQFKTVGELINSGYAEKLGIDLSLDPSTILVLSKDQKKILTGTNTRGEDVLFFTPPTQAGILGEGVSALSYAGIGGPISYEGRGVLFESGKPMGYVTKTPISKEFGLGEVGFTKKGSPFRGINVKEVELGLQPGSQISFRELSGRRRIAGKELTFEGVRIESMKLNDINLRLNELNTKTFELQSMKSNIDITPSKLTEINKKLDDINSRKNVLLKEQQRLINKVNENLGYSNVQQTGVKKTTISKELKYYGRVLGYKPTSSYKTPTTYKTPPIYKTPSTYKAPSTYKTPPIYKTPTVYKTPDLYKIPQMYKTPPRYKTPSTYKTPPRYKPRVEKMPRPMRIAIPPVKPTPISKRTEPGYWVEVKSLQTKKFVRVNDIPVTKKRALDVGSYTVDNSVVRTYRIVSAKKNAGTDYKTGYVPDNYFDISRRKFREFKIRKGTPVDVGAQFIEKNIGLIDSAREKAQLEYFRKLQKNIMKR